MFETYIIVNLPLLMSIQLLVDCFSSRINSPVGSAFGIEIFVIQLLKFPSDKLSPFSFNIRFHLSQLTSEEY